MGQLGKVITGGDEREFVDAFVAGLREADGGGESVTDALAAKGFLGAAAFAPKMFEGFGGAAVTYGAVGLAIEMAQVAQVTNARARVVVGGV